MVACQFYQVYQYVFMHYANMHVYACRQVCVSTGMYIYAIMHVCIYTSQNVEIWYLQLKQPTLQGSIVKFLGIGPSSQVYFEGIQQDKAKAKPDVFSLVRFFAWSLMVLIILNLAHSFVFLYWTNLHCSKYPVQKVFKCSKYPKCSNVQNI